MADFPFVNDMECSWADIGISFTVFGGPVIEEPDVSAVKWDRAVEVGVKRGASGGRVRSRTRGSGSQNASMTMYRGGLLRLIRGLMQKAPLRGNQRIIGVVQFDILVQHTPLLSTEIFKTKIKGCRYLGDSDDMSEGNEADTVEVTLNPIEVAQIIDGQEVVLI